MTSAYFADDGLVAKWGYHPQTQELTLIKYSVNGLPQTQVAYGSHDKNGNIGREIRAVRVNGTWTPVIKPYTYDGLDRLKTGPDGSLSDTYEYTPGGDITRGGSYYDPTNGATYESYSYNNASLAHAATSILPSKKYAFAIRDLAYDNAGRLRTSTLQTSPAQQTVYTFNAGDCLRRMAFTHPGTGVSYTSDQWCDAEGNRVVRSTLAGTARKRMVPFLGLGEIRPDDGVGLFVWRLPVNGTVAVEEARKLSDGTFVGGPESGFVMSDIRGSVVAETDLQGVPAIVEAHEYDPYGDERAVGALPLSEHGYVGGERDPEFGVYTYGVRTYDPSLRRWLSQEPEWLGQGPIGLNGYQYANNNPVRFTDPTGRAVFLLFWAPQQDAPGDKKAGVPGQEGQFGHVSVGVEDGAGGVRMYGVFPESPTRVAAGLPSKPLNEATTRIGLQEVASYQSREGRPPDAMLRLDTTPKQDQAVRTAASKEENKNYSISNNCADAAAWSLVPLGFNPGKQPALKETRTFLGQEKTFSTPGGLLNSLTAPSTGALTPGVGVGVLKDSDRKKFAGPMPHEDGK